jgi:hypothetical protein
VITLYKHSELQSQCFHKWEFPCIHTADLGTCFYVRYTSQFKVQYSFKCEFPYIQGLVLDRYFDIVSDKLLQLTAITVFQKCLFPVNRGSVLFFFYRFYCVLCFIEHYSGLQTYFPDKYIFTYIQCLLYSRYTNYHVGLKLKLFDYALFD